MMFRRFVILTLLVFAAFATCQYAQTFTVNSTADTPPWDDPNTPDINEADDGICRDQFGQCSLRAAMYETNGGVNFPRTINLQTSGTISLTLPMPLYLVDGFKLIGNANTTIRQTVDGLSVLGIGGDDIELRDAKIEAPTNTGVAVMQGSNIKIQNCQITNCGYYGLSIAGGQNISVLDNVLSGNQLAGLQITGFGISGIDIRRNKIGTNAAGTQSKPNGMAGISIPASIIPMQNITIGGNSIADRNIISGNSNYGIQVLMNGVTIKNNYIGTTADGRGKLANENAGITINASNTYVANNIISGNSLYGIYLHSGGTVTPNANTITGNIIGGKAGDTSALGNGIGIFIAGSASGNIIGSGVSQMNDANVIAHNADCGIIIANTQSPFPSKNSFRKNMFYGNGAKSIKVMSGTQNGIAIPILDSLSSDAAGTTKLYGHGASPSAIVDVYKGVKNAAGISEGKTWITQTSADGAGQYYFDVTGMGCDELIVMQTDAQGNSSELSGSINPEPASISCVAECAGPYIAGIAYPNSFTLKINWGGMPAANRRVTFALNGANELDGTITGDEAKVQYDMALLTPGNNSLSWKFYKCDGTTIPNTGITLCATPRPDWYLLPVTAACNGGSVQYESYLSFPETVTHNVQNVPSYVDYIAGALSFLNVPKYSATIKVPGQSPTFTFNNSFDILGFSMRLNAYGHANMNHTCGSIFPSGTAGLSGRFQQTFYAGYNLESLLPSCTGILSWPILNDGCEKLHSLARSLRVGAKVGGRFSLNATVVLNNGLTLSSGQGKLGLYVKPFLDIFFIHARGTGRIDVSVDLPSFSLTNFSGSLSGKIYSDFPLGILRFEKRIGPWNFGPDNPDMTSMYPAGRTGNAAVMLDDAIEEQGLFMLSDSLMVPHVVPDAEAVTASGASGFKAAVWNGYYGANARPAGDIALRIANGSTWSGEIAISGDMNIDRSPAVAFDGQNRVVVCWERNTSSEIPPEADMYAPSYLKKFEIAYAVVNQLNGSIITSGSFTDTAAFDAKPRLSRAKNGTLLLVWQQTDGTTEFGKTGSPLTLKSAEWNGQSWSVTRTVNASLTGVLSWEAASYDTSKAMIAMVRDTDNLLGTTQDLEVFSLSRAGAQWQAPVRITSDNAVDWGAHCAFTNTGKPVLMWLRDSVVVGVRDNLLGTPQRWLDSLYHGIDFIDAKMTCVNDTLVAAWSEAGGVYYSYTDVNTIKWSRPQAISLTPDIQKSVSLDNGGGQITLGFLEFPYADSIPPVGTYASIYLASVRLSPEPTSIRDEGRTEPPAYQLFETYPNPFNSSMVVRFTIQADTRAAIHLYDMLGRERAVIADGYYQTGIHSVTFKADALPSGVYFARLTAGKEHAVRKVILSK